MGVGVAGASAVSATLNFIMRDGAGMFATLGFSTTFGERFGSDLKRWRLFADVIVDVAIFLEIVAVLLPKVYFVPLICLASCFKAMCGVAAGACGGAISAHWASYPGGSIADVAAKSGAQHTVTAIAGLLSAAAFSAGMASVPPLALWSAVGGLTVLHIVANAKAMRLLALTTVNQVRLRVLVGRYLDGKPLLPTDVARAEPLWWRPRRRVLRVGAPLADLARAAGGGLDALRARYAHERYAVAAGPRAVLVAFRDDATADDVLMAGVEAVLVERGCGDAAHDAAADMVPGFAAALAERGWEPCDAASLGGERWVYEGEWDDGVGGGE